MKSLSQQRDFSAGDLARLTSDMINFYNMYGPVDPGFLSGDSVLILEISDARALVIDPYGNKHSTSLRKLEPV